MSIRVNGKVIASNGDVKTETDNLVTTDTNQTITATKVFTAEQQKKSTVIDITTQPENYSPNNAFRFLDKNGQISGWIENAQMASGEITTGIHARNKDGYQPRVSVFAPLTGMTGAYAIAPITPEDAPIDAITTKGYVDGKTGGLELLDITFAPLGIDESKNKRRYLNGQVLIQEQFPAFTAAVKARMTTMANAFTTETNWQAEKINSKLGQCGKFVVDDTAGTIRLPCVVNAQGLADLALIGGIKSESLPNITGDFGNVIGNNATGCFGIKSSQDLTVDGSNRRQTSVVSFDASRSSSTYQNSAPVQQEAIQYPYCIQVATGVEEELPAIREYKINTPFFFGQSMYSDVAPDNASWLVSNGQYNAKTVYPDYYDWLLEQMNAGVSGFVASTDTYTDYDFVINTTDQTFRLPLLNGEEDIPDYNNRESCTSGTTYTALKRGVFYGYSRLHEGDKAWVTINGIQQSRYAGSNDVSGNPSNGSFYFEIGVGDSYSAVISTGAGYFAPYKGNGSLYYYVGDTVQDASLINAGAVLGQLSDKISRTATSDREMVIGWGMPNYNAPVDITASVAAGYTATYKQCVVVQCTKNAVQYSSATITINNISYNMANTSNNNQWNESNTLFLILDVGDTLETNSTNAGWRIVAYPLKGA